MQSRSISRELALLILGQVSDNQMKGIDELSIDDLLCLGLETLLNHWREQLDNCASEIDSAQQEIIDSELEDLDKGSSERVRNSLRNSLHQSESVLNSLSDSIELSQLLAASFHNSIKDDAMKRVSFVIQSLNLIDSALDQVMEGWRLKRLPRIDRDILRLAYVDMYEFNTPIAVSCNEAVNLAHRYSDEQGRKMINGILRRLQDSSNKQIA